jgi:formimidoylglutamate deiminase
MQLALQGGAQALGMKGGTIAVGGSANLVSLKAQHPAMICRDSDALIDAWIFASSGNVVDCVWVDGRKVVADGRHFARQEIKRGFVEAMKELRS